MNPTAIWRCLRAGNMGPPDQAGTAEIHTANAFPPRVSGYVMFNHFQFLDGAELWLQANCRLMNVPHEFLFCGFPVFFVYLSPLAFYRFALLGTLSLFAFTLLQRFVHLVQARQHPPTLGDMSRSARKLQQKSRGRASRVVVSPFYFSVDGLLLLHSYLHTT